MVRVCFVRVWFGFDVLVLRPLGWNDISFNFSDYDWLIVVLVF